MRHLDTVTGGDAERSYSRLAQALSPGVHHRDCVLLSSDDLRVEIWDLTRTRP